MRLDRRVEFNERSRAYPARALVDTSIPRNKSWRLNTWLDQGDEGACVGFAWAHELAAYPVPVNTITNEFARQLYHEAKLVDPWPGEDYEGTSVLAGAKVVKAKGYISEYRWAFGLDDLALAVSHLGPAVIGVNWYEGMNSVWDCKRLHPFYPFTPKGGHAILVTGVNVTNRYFTLRNSWGRNWGYDGACRVGFNLMETLLMDDGEACIPMARRLP